MGCGAWGETLVDKKTAIYYANIYSETCSLSREDIYHLAFLAEKMLECESVDSAVEVLIEYEEANRKKKIININEALAFDGLKILEDLQKME